MLLPVKIGRFNDDPMNQAVGLVYKTKEACSFVLPVRAIPGHLGQSLPGQPPVKAIVAGSPVQE